MQKQVWQRALRTLRWVPVSLAVAVLAGSASALLLWSLDVATRLREGHRWIVALLAPAGFLVGWLYDRVGKSVASGNKMVMQEARSPRSVIPLRMTPLILLGTFVSHLFGASAGREGTALQTGASLADQLAKPFKLDRRVLLMAGISAGFASVFGTPWAGAVFALEVVGGLRYRAIAPCVIAAFAADWVTRAWRIHHQVYALHGAAGTSAKGVLAAIAAGLLFGLVAKVFVRATHPVSAAASRWIAYAPMRPFAGGVVVSAAVFAAGTTKYVGLGIPTIVDAFARKLPVYDWAAKLAFTAVTLGSGFKGGEVTPLFFIGATLGNALSGMLPIAPSLLAGMGFAAVFAGAANTPVAATVMAMELFGVEAGIYAGIACFVSYLVSESEGIYHTSPNDEALL